MVGGAVNILKGRVMKNNEMLLLLVITGCLCSANSELLAAKKGRLVISGPSTTRIFLNKTYKGYINRTGRLAMQNLKPGSYTLTAVKKGDVSQRMSVTVVAGRKGYVILKQFTLKSVARPVEIGSLSVQSSPIKCKIIITKAKISHDKTQSTWVKDELPIGTYAIVAVSGSRRLAGKFTVKANMQTNLVLNLETKKIETKSSSASRLLVLNLGKGRTLKLRSIPAGKFLMGSPVTEQAGRGVRRDHEGPRREVTISKTFYMGIYEITQVQWKAVMGTEPWNTVSRTFTELGDNYAANEISWDKATKFCQTLSKKTGRNVTLPTEAQWEYACRAGSQTAFSFGEKVSDLGDYGWYLKSAVAKNEKYPHMVGKKKPNAFGLYDMHGNVWEWCRDWYDGDFYAKAKKIDPENTTKAKGRIQRGGSWINPAENCRSAGREWHSPGAPHYDYGFRVIVESSSG